MRILGMESSNCKLVAVCPAKDNITYCVQEFMSLDDIFGGICKLLKLKQHGRTIVFCPTIQDCTDVYIYLKESLGSSFLCPPDAPDKSEYRVVDIFHSLLEESHKSRIIASFSNSSSPLRIIIATVAFGLGIDFADIDKIIHFGAPEDIDMYIQETGRGGRDGRQCQALLLSRKTRLHVDAEMQAYTDLKSPSCRRDFLFGQL